MPVPTPSRPRLGSGGWRRLPLLVSGLVLAASVAGAPPAAAQETPGVSLDRRTAVAGQPVVATARGAAGQAVELLGYSKPSSTYTRLRSGTFDSSGVVRWTLYPQTSTRVLARSRGRDSASTAVDVAPAVTLAARGSGRTWTFSGALRPARDGVLVTLYRASGTGRVASGQVRTSGGGRYSLTRTFTGSGRFAFHTATSADGTNVAGRSAAVTVAVGAPAAWETTDGRTFVRNFLATWKRGDTAGMRRYATDTALGQFRESPSAWRGYEVSDRQDCSPSSGGSDGCLFGLIHSSGGYFFYDAILRRTDSAGHLRITAFDTVGGGA